MAKTTSSHLCKSKSYQSFLLLKDASREARKEMAKKILRQEFSADSNNNNSINQEEEQAARLRLLGESTRSLQSSVASLSRVSSTSSMRKINSHQDIVEEYTNIMFEFQDTYDQRTGGDSSITGW